MADSPLQTDFPITIGGKQYTLSYPLESLWAYEDMSGESLFDDPRSKEELQEAHEKRKTRDKIKLSLDLLAAGLMLHHPEITRKQVGQMVHLSDLAVIDAEVSKAYLASLPKAAKEASPLEVTAEKPPA